MLAFGLASVPFINGLYANWTEISVNLPQVESNTPLYIQLPKPLPEPETIVQNRNLSDYEFGGNFSNCNEIEETEIRKCEANADKARNFILKYWQTKKRAYIVYERIGTHGGNDHHIFIEPDENGNWHIIERWETGFPIIDGRDFRFVKSQDSRDVKRKPKTKDVDWMPGKYYLQFFDKDGNEDGTL